jgi:hypothetical protein
MELTLVVDLQAKLARLMEARGTDLTAAACCGAADSVPSKRRRLALPVNLTPEVS